MIALSVCQPWASRIADGTKTVEYRTWSTDYRGPLLICASKQAWEGATPDQPRGVAVCIVELVEVRQEGDGVYGWVLDHVRLTAPVPVRGRQRLFEVPDEVAQLVSRETPAPVA